MMTGIEEATRTECERCGTCCERGGPALHVQDRDLLGRGVVTLADLVTIRQGEIVVDPDSGRPQASEVELVKFQGRDGHWCCRFLDPDSRTCTIYDHRPLACRLLKCWDPADLLALAGKEVLSRFDFIAADDPLLPLVRLHDQQCALPDMIEVAASLDNPGRRERAMAQLQQMVEKDLLLRTIAIDQFRLSVALELFYFGRPLFQLLIPMGVAIRESETGLSLTYGSR